MIPAFALVYAVIAMPWKLPNGVAGLWLAVSAVTFIAFAANPSAACRGTWRTPQSTLHTLSLAGGWPGALLAQRVLRHGSTKRPFKQVFWATVVLIVVGLVAWTSTS